MSLFEQGLFSGDALKDSTSDNTTEPNMPYKLGTSFENSPLSYNSALNRVESSTAFYAPTLVSDPGTLELGNINVDSANTVIGLLNKSDGQRSLLVQQMYDDTGSKDVTIDTLGSTPKYLCVRLIKLCTSLKYGSRNNWSENSVAFLLINFLCKTKPS